MGRITPKAPCGPTYRYIELQKTATAEFTDTYKVPEAYKTTIIDGLILHVTGTDTVVSVFIGGKGAAYLTWIGDDIDTIYAIPCWMDEVAVGVGAYAFALKAQLPLELHAGDSIKLTSGDATSEARFYIKEELV